MNFPAIAASAQLPETFLQHAEVAFIFLSLRDAQYTPAY